MSALTPAGIQYVVQGFGQGIQQLNQLDKAQQTLGKSGDNLSSQFAGLGKSMLSMGAIAGGAALAGVTALAGGIAAFATEGIGKAMDLDAQMATIAATMNETKAAVGPLKDLIMNLALDPNLTVNTTQAADAIQLLAQNGVTMKDMLDGAAASTVALANATGSQFSTAADIASGVMRVFNIDAQNMGLAIDGITGVTNQSKFTIDDYGQAFAQAGGIASQMGVSFQDFNTVITASATSFNSGSDAGTSFKTMLQRLANPTDEMKAAMDKYGVSLFDAEGKMRPLGEVAGQLNAIFQGQITVTESVGGATKKAAAEAEAARGNIDGLRASISTNEKQLSLYNDQLSLEIGYYGAGSPKVRQRQIQIEKLSQTINGQNGTLAEYEKAINLVDNAHERQITTTKTLTEAEKAELAVVLGGSDASRSVLALSTLTADKFDILSGSVNESGQAFRAAATRVDSLKGSFEIFKGIIEAIEIQVGDLFLPILREITVAFTDLASQSGPKIVDFFKRLLSTVQDVMKAMGESGIDFSGIFGAIQGGDFGQIASSIEANLSLAFNTIKTQLLMAWGEIKGQILVWALETPGILSAVILAFQSGNWANVGTVIAANLALAWNTIKTQLSIWGAQFMGWVAEVYPTIPARLTLLVNSITSAIATNWPAIKSSLTEWGNKFWGWVNETAIPALNGAMMGLAIALAAWATSSDAQTAMTNLGTTLGKVLMDVLGLTVGNAENSNKAMGELGTGLLGATATIAGSLLVIGGQVVAGILSGILASMGIDLKPATFNELSTILTGIGTDIMTIASVVGTNIVTGITTGITTMQTTLETSLFDFCTGVIDYVKQMFGIASPSTVFAGYGADLILGFIQGITANAAKLFEAVGNLFSNLLSGGGTIDLTSLTTTLPQALLTNLNNANALFITLTGINNMISLLWPASLKVLSAISTEVFDEMATKLTTIEQKFTSIQSAISAVGAAVRIMGTTAATSLAALNSAIDTTKSKFSELESAASGAASASKSVAKTAEKYAALSNAIDKVTDAFKAMKLAAEEAATASGAAGSAGQAATGIGFAQGIGFAAGTPGNTGGLLGLGYQVPVGYPNDSFGPLYVQSGEQMLVTPRNTSIDEVVFNRVKALGMPAYGGAPSINVTVGSINNGMDLAMLQNIIERTVAQSFA